MTNTSTSSSQPFIDWVDSVVLVPTTKINKELAKRIENQTQRIVDEILQEEENRIRKRTHHPVHPL